MPYINILNLSISIRHESTKVKPQAKSIAAAREESECEIHLEEQNSKWLSKAAAATGEKVA